MNPSPKTIPDAIALLNDLSKVHWGRDAPVYSHTIRRSSGPGSSPIYLIHRTDQKISPFLPADVLFARGSRDHVLAKLRSAIRFASESQ